MIILMSLIFPVQGQEMSGVWLSPDWLFPGERKYSEAEVRASAQEVLSNLARAGVDTVFLETFLRGYGICPTISLSSEQGLPQVLTYRPGTNTSPVYPHLWWPYRAEYGVVHDPLQIFIDEGQKVGVEIHAWIHLFYWRMDNTDVMLPWHDGLSVWASLMSEYLRIQAEQLEFAQGRTVRPGYEQQERATLGDLIPVAVVAAAAEIFDRGCDVRELESLLRQAGYRTQGRPIGVLIAEIIKAGGDRPDFLLLATDQDPFPAPRGKRLRPIYVNPAHPVVRQTLLEVCQNIVSTHPGLGGLHLDHIRYPVDGQGLSQNLGIEDGSIRYFSASDPEQMRTYRALQQELELRQASLAELVTEIRAVMPRRFPLSAAVLPLYYRDRDQNRFRSSGYDYSAQAWLDWPVDFVVPMMYEYHPYIIRTLVRDYQKMAKERNERRPIKVFPGISRLAYTRNGGVDSDGWVFFDLSFARDVQFKRQQTEDLDFGGE